MGKPLKAVDTGRDPEPAVWIFYSGNRAKEAEWVQALEPGQTIYWFHGRVPKGGAYKHRIRTGDTVILLVVDEIVATGVLLSDESLKFIDAQGRIRRPVRIVEVFQPPLQRRLIEERTGASLIRQGSVHPVAPTVIDLVNELRGQRDRLPHSQLVFAELLANRSLAQDVREQAPWILPDKDTAAALGLPGEVRSSEFAPPPSARTRTIKQRPDPEPSDAEPASEVEEELEPDASPINVDARIPFVLDAPADSEDELDRGPFALFLAQRLHLIWCQLNGQAPDGKDGRTRPQPADSDTFIAHVDSPWGGGKTTFANFLARVLDPRDEVLSARHFLTASLAPTVAADELKDIPLQDVFVPPYAREKPWDWPGARRPWVVARYNAWRDQYVQPPWWQVFLTIQRQIAREVRRDALSDLKAAWNDPARIEPAVGGFAGWLRLGWERFSYQVWNAKLKTQLTVWLVLAIVVIGVWGVGFSKDWSLAQIAKALTEPKKVTEWIGMVVAVLALGGASISALITIVSQSLTPDLDFTAEHKQIGVQDPISRFRRSFDRILKATPRPILLIVDDLDRCDPKTIVELLRGFQTIIRSPRLFVLLLGDRAWIENAHDVHHKELAGLREGEGKLGARFVQKVIQLSFRLPTMAPQARERLARRILDDASPEAQDQVVEALQKVEAEIAPLIRARRSVGDLEAAGARVAEEVTRDLAETLPVEQQAQAAQLIQQMVSNRIVVAAGSDARQQASVFNAVTQLVDSLPNNPRQIKRIFMAFAVYEVVGRAFFQYQLTPEGPDGETRARRWRQLAMWVTLAVEWPETWRAVARRPAFLEAAYGSARRRPAAESRLLADMPADEHDDAKAVLHRLRTDKTIGALLSGEARTLGGPIGGFAEIAMEAEAVLEFNCILWEPGFPTIAT